MLCILRVGVCGMVVACFGLIDVVLSLTCCTLFSFSVFTADLGSYRPSVSSLCWDVARDTILIGTRGSEIYEISASDGSDQHGGPLVQGHCEHELWGLAVHPSKSQVCTVGDDKTVRVWDTASKQLLKMTKLDTAARTCAYSPDGMTIAVGLGAPESSGVTRSKKDGALVVLNEEDLTVIFESKCGMVHCGVWYPKQFHSLTCSHDIFSFLVPQQNLYSSGY